MSSSSPTRFSQRPNLDIQPPECFSPICSPLGPPCFCFDPCSGHVFCFLGFEAASSASTASSLEPLTSFCAGLPDCSTSSSIQNSSPVSHHLRIQSQHTFVWHKRMFVVWPFSTVPSPVIRQLPIYVSLQG